MVDNAMFVPPNKCEYTFDMWLRESEVGNEWAAADTNQPGLAALPAHM
jgi:hypothetical protein